jgi:hypothetical protein
MPAWITPELVRHTLEVWQKRSSTPLSEADAIEILTAFGRLADALMPPPYPTNSSIPTSEKEEHLRP